MELEKIEPGGLPTTPPLGTIDFPPQVWSNEGMKEPPELLRSGESERRVEEELLLLLSLSWSNSGEELISGKCVGIGFSEQRGITECVSSKFRYLRSEVISLVRSRWFIGVYFSACGERQEVNSGARE